MQGGRLSIPASKCGFVQTGGLVPRLEIPCSLRPSRYHAFLRVGLFVSFCDAAKHALVGSGLRG